MVRNILTSVLLIFLTQNILISQAEEKKFHFGININPFRTALIFKNDRLGSSDPSFNFSLGLDFYYDLSPRIQLISGLNYQWYNVSQLDYSPRFGCDFRGADFDSFNSWLEDDFEIHYLSIPLSARIKLVGNESHLYTRFGGEALFKVSHSTDSFIAECGTNQIEIEEAIQNQPKDFLMEINFGVGFEFSASRTFKLFLEPEISYTLQAVLENMGVASDRINNNRFLNIGLRVGVRM